MWYSSFLFWFTFHLHLHVYYSSLHYFTLYNWLYLCRAKEISNHQMIVQAGLIEVAQRGPGSFIGEHSLVTAETRNASVIARQRQWVEV